LHSAPFATFFLKRLVRLMDFWNLVVVLLHLVNQLRCVQLAVASSCSQNSTLLFKREVLPDKIRSHDLLEESKNLIKS
jgi:hypothetical protein